MTTSDHESENHEEDKDLNEENDQMEQQNPNQENNQIAQTEDLNEQLANQQNSQIAQTENSNGQIFNQVNNQLEQQNSNQVIIQLEDISLDVEDSGNGGAQQEENNGTEEIEAQVDKERKFKQVDKQVLKNITQSVLSTNFQVHDMINNH